MESPNLESPNASGPDPAQSHSYALCHDLLVRLMSSEYVEHRLLCNPYFKDEVGNDEHEVGKRGGRNALLESQYKSLFS